MWAYAGAHYTLLLGLAAGLIWGAAVVWFLFANGFAGEWIAALLRKMGRAG